MSAKRKERMEEKLKEDFVFSLENQKRADVIIGKYPKGRQRSAMIPLLDLAQRQNGGWLSVPVIQYVADYLEQPFIKAYEVATFYTMFNLKPVGKHFIQVCRTTPCWLRGSDDLTQRCKQKLDIDIGESTADGEFTLIEVECLGACVNAPIVQINDDYYEDLTPQRLDTLLDELLDGKKVDIGSQTGRQCSAPETGLTTLKDVK